MSGHVSQHWIQGLCISVNDPIKPFRAPHWTFSKGRHIKCYKQKDDATASQNMERKSRKILDAITAGHSCEQILSNDGTLTYHDIFHVVTKAPTSFWKKVSVKNTVKGCPVDTTLSRLPSQLRD
jgi:hypothetical protein